MRKVWAWMILTAFCTNTFVPPSFAQALVPAPGQMASLSPSWRPAMLTGIKVYPDDPLRMDLILDQGDRPLEGKLPETDQLIRYFLASLAVPNKDLWVNLSPYEKDRIIPVTFGQTEMGRDLLAQDYLLKQITSSLMHPDSGVGREFWSRIYARAQEEFGTTDIPVDTFNKVWIVPAKARVFENGRAAYVIESRLKVMLESDYLAAQRASKESVSIAGTDNSMSVGEDLVSSHSSAMAKDVVRQIIIPVLEKEINEGTNFAAVRQVYNALILALWYKKKVKAGILASAYVDQNKVMGVNIDDPRQSEKIWAQYVEAFKKGAFNFIKEEEDPYSQEMIPRKYFSGGIPLLDAAEILEFTPEHPVETPDHASVVRIEIGKIDHLEDFTNMQKALDWSTPNEPSTLFAHAAGMRGAAIVTGQNFSFAARGDFDLYLMADINPYVTEAFLPIKSALLALSKNVEEYLGFLEGFLPEESRDQVSPAVRLDQARKNEIWERMISVHPQLSGNARAQKFWETTFFKNKGIINWFSMVRKAREESNDLLSWLGSEEGFQRVKKLFESGKVRFLTIDWFSRGSGMRITEALNAAGGTKLSLAHISNILEWIINDEELDQDQKDSKRASFMENLNTFLPMMGPGGMIVNTAHRYDPFSPLPGSNIVVLTESGQIIGHPLSKDQALDVLPEDRAFSLSTYARILADKIKRFRPKALDEAFYKAFYAEVLEVIRPLYPDVITALEADPVKGEGAVSITNESDFMYRYSSYKAQVHAIIFSSFVRNLATLIAAGKIKKPLKNRLLKLWEKDIELVDKLFRQEDPVLFLAREGSEGRVVGYIRGNPVLKWSPFPEWMIKLGMLRKMGWRKKPPLEKVAYLGEWYVADKSRQSSMALLASKFNTAVREKGYDYVLSVIENEAIKTKLRKMEGNGAWELFPWHGASVFLYKVALDKDDTVRNDPAMISMLSLIGMAKAVFQKLKFSRAKAPSWTEQQIALKRAIGLHHAYRDQVYSHFVDILKEWMEAGHDIRKLRDIVRASKGSVLARSVRAYRKAYQNMLVLANLGYSRDEYIQTRIAGVCRLFSEDMIRAHGTVVADLLEGFHFTSEDLFYDNLSHTVFVIEVSGQKIVIDPTAGLLMNTPENALVMGHEEYKNEFQRLMSKSFPAQRVERLEREKDRIGKEFSLMRFKYGAKISKGDLTFLDNSMISDKDGSERSGQSFIDVLPWTTLRDVEEIIDELTRNDNYLWGLLKNDPDGRERVLSRLDALMPVIENMKGYLESKVFRPDAGVKYLGCFVLGSYLFTRDPSDVDVVVLTTGNASYSLTKHDFRNMYLEVNMMGVEKFSKMTGSGMTWGALMRSSLERTGVILDSFAPEVKLPDLNDMLRVQQAMNLILDGYNILESKKAAGVNKAVNRYIDAYDMVRGIWAGNNRESSMKIDALVKDYLLGDPWDMEDVHRLSSIIESVVARVAGLITDNSMKDVQDEGMVSTLKRLRSIVEVSESVRSLDPYQTIQSSILAYRAGISKTFGQEVLLASELGGRCVAAQEWLEKKLLMLYPYAHIRQYQAVDVLKKIHPRGIREKDYHGHLFLVVSLMEKDFLIDPTFLQFFDPDRGTEAAFIIKTTDEIEGTSFTATAQQLLRDGFIELTDDVADMYLSVLAGKFVPNRQIFKKRHLLGNSVPINQYSDKDLERLVGPFNSIVKDAEKQALEIAVAEAVAISSFDQAGNGSGTGGIDLQSAEKNIETTGSGIQLNMTGLANADWSNIDGVRPVILGVTTLESLPEFLGVR